MSGFTPALTFHDAFLHLKQGYGIKPETVSQTAEQTAAAIAVVEARVTAKEYDFISVLSQTTYLDQVEAVFTQVKWADTLVIVGIGGSDLGARAIQQALQGEHPPMRVLFHGDSTDPEAITRLFRIIDLTKTVFVIISKSGQTVETVSQYVFIKRYCQQGIPEWQKHFVFITDEKSGVLRQEADQHQVATLPIPDGVGGRFSVQTPVGLLAAKAMGVDIRALINGAAEAAADPTFRQQAQQLATTQFQLYRQGLKLVVLMPYSVQLEEFARWFRQLWAESLGKDGKGILPIQARGPADQHSQEQFYVQGELLHSLLYLRVDHRPETYPITQVDVPELKYLEGHSFQELVNIEQRASALSLAKAGRPSATLAIDSLTPASLGQLFIFFELAVVYLAEMLGVNAFDQPGVEEGKNFIYALLGREGFEVKRAEIEQLEKDLV